MDKSYINYIYFYHKNKFFAIEYEKFTQSSHKNFLHFFKNYVKIICMLKTTENNRNNELFENNNAEKIFPDNSSEKISKDTNQILQKILNWGQFNNTDIWLMIHEYSKNPNQKILSKNLQNLVENPRDFDISIFANDEKIFKIVKNFQEKYISQKIN